MAEGTLPNELKGEWIWKVEEANEIDSYAFFRHEFTIAESPTSAELWISARSLFHVFVNGRFICYGPSPAPDGKTCLSSLNIGYCLEVGNNVIAILGHNAKIPRSTGGNSDGGVWCQLEIDGKPLLWSDSSWSVYNGECYLQRQPRISRTAGFVESLDLRKFPHGWAEVEFDASGWDQVEVATPLRKSDSFVAIPNFELNPEKFPFDNLISRGQTLQDKTATHVFFSAAIKNAHGLYVAETFVKVENDLDDTLFYLFSDDPYAFFVNDQLVKSQGVSRPINYTSPSVSAPKCYQQSKIADVDGTVSLKSGWNRLIFFQQIDTNSSGATFVFPDIGDGDVKFVKGTGSFGLPGWNVAGPLKTPLAQVEGSISLEGYPAISYYALHPCDESAHLLAYSYETNEHLNDAVDYVDLRINEYAVFDLEDYQRGIIELIITGSSGDNVDIVFGEYMQGNVIPPFDQGIRRTCPLILDDDGTIWRSVAPHGMKYLMIVIRHAAEMVNIQQIGLRSNAYSYPHQNEFSSADELLNQLWDFGKITLNSTHDYVFYNSGSFLEGQILADAMIQGLASIYVYGTPELSAKGLREFADAQYETGEIPSMVPSGLNLRYHDFAMMWPVWLYYHVFNSGDKALLESLVPNLKRLLEFFAGITDPESGLLGNTKAPYKNHCLIDYDKSIDKKGLSTGLNAIYCFCLLKCEWLFNYIEMKEDAEACVKLASSVAAKVRDLTWNKDKGLFADAWYDGKPSKKYSMQSNVLALCAGVADPKNYESIFNKMFFEDAPFQEVITDKYNENPYFKFFVLDMAFTLNLREWALDYMRYYWGRMVQAGATSWWNKFCPDIEFGPESAQSICHGYGVSPNYFLIREIAGIRLADPDGSRIYYNPVLTACEWLKVKFQTKRGAIKAEWSHQETGGLEIHIESEYPLEVVAQLDPNIAKDPTIHINDDVKIVEEK